MPGRGKIEAADLSKARGVLRQMAKERKNPATLSVREAVSAMQKDIRAALEAGYTIREVARSLSEAGVKVSATTLKQYLRQNRPAVPCASGEKTPPRQPGASDAKDSDSVVDAASESAASTTSLT